ncbi:unnamed protein product [Enterobius vermicularis]|uniref:40S ribosomal protein S15 n=1 Tax=Enterobius vermicularis TaxID=51028 RepID=A0A0N4VQD1_ENTVE|nr:unnamed protein product [Enterobius vermicularis]
MISVDELPDRVRLQKLKVTVLKVREFCTVSQDSLRLPECSQALENLLTAGMMRMISRYLHMVRFGK